MGYSFILAVTLAFDAFAVAVSLGLSSSVRKQADKIKVALFFGFFQFFMPFVGGFVFNSFFDKYGNIVNIFAAASLLFLGGKMIYESFQPQPNMCENKVCDTSCVEEVCKRNGKSKKLKLSEILHFSIATSIDSLLAAPVISALQLKFTVTTIIIGVVTFIMSYIGINFSKVVSVKMEKKFEFIGGVILILLMLKAIN